MHDLTISIPPPQESQETIPTSVQINQPQNTSPLVSIEIPNMDVIENEIQEREKQRSRTTTVTAMNNNVNTKVESLINSQPLPARKPTISITQRVQSPSKALDQINTNLQSSPSKQSSPLHMKPLPVTAVTQPLLQPLNNSHKPKVTLQQHTQASLPNILTHTTGLNSGPQTAPVTSISNSDMLDSSIRARTQMRIQMPVPVSATASSFPILNNENSTSNLMMQSKAIIGESIEKNQFGFDINAVSSIPLAMTPVTESPHYTVDLTEKDESSGNTIIGSVNGTINSNPGLLGYPSGSDLPIYKLHQHGNSVSISNNNNNNNNNNIGNDRKMSADSINNLKIQTSSNISNVDMQRQRNDSMASGSNLSDDSEQADITLTNANTTTSTTTTGNINNGVIDSNSENSVTGLGMMTMNDNGNISPVRINNSQYNISISSERLHKIVESSQMSMNKIMALSLSINYSESEETNESNMYIDEIDNLLGRMSDIMGMVINGLK
ncbi:hypothetical protein C6P40_003582 [Pichia californica]|uniref:Uncharacterized protein n=1 Tax=Pichia californica TaxID=460514 RepID=A0A9P6WJ14_9ASCO|nr:hypothetical protein C6P40_003582 [[Candida] californica]